MTWCGFSLTTSAGGPLPATVEAGRRVAAMLERIAASRTETALFPLASQ